MLKPAEIEAGFEEFMVVDWDMRMYDTLCTSRKKSVAFAR